MTFTEFTESEAARSPHLLLAGNPVAHSLSPLMHNAAAELLDLPLRYHAVRLEEPEFSAFLAWIRREPFRGGNITIPWKQRFVEAVDALDVDAKGSGAVNTLVRQRGTVTGYNTDIHGFLQPLHPLREELEGRPAVIFGTGGAALAAVRALRQLGTGEIAVISRDPDRARGSFPSGTVRVEGYETWTAFAGEAALVVNTTPLGMAPAGGESPVRDSEAQWLAGKIVYDIVYRPLQTRLLRQAREAGARTIGGLDMLLHQGSRSFELWTGTPFPLSQIRSRLHEAVD